MTNVRNLKGSIVALVTPFHQDETVNFEVLTQLIEFQIREGTDGIVILGTTGESSTMSHEEDDAVVAHTVSVVAGRVPVIVGTGSNCTQTMLEKSLRAQAMGADGLLLISPYYNKSNVEGMYQHFATVADAVEIPSILYNVPSRTGCSIPPVVVERLSHHPNICGIKEASGDLSYVMKIAHCITPEFALYSGNDDIVLPLLAVGGSGVISVCANIIPKVTHHIVMDFLTGNHERALATNLQYLQLMNDLFMEVNPIPVKTAMNLMGMNCGPFRKPMWEMDPVNREKLRKSLAEAGLV